MVKNHGDRKSPKDRVIPFPNGGDPNHVSKSWDDTLRTFLPSILLVVAFSSPESERICPATLFHP